MKTLIGNAFLLYDKPDDDRFLIRAYLNLNKSSNINYASYMSRKSRYDALKICSRCRTNNFVCSAFKLSVWPHKKLLTEKGF